MNFSEGMPSTFKGHEIPERVFERGDDLIRNGYNYFGRVKNNFFLAKTNSAGHKVLKIKTLDHKIH